MPDCFGPVPPFQTRAEHATELAVELAPTSKPLEEIDDRVEAGNLRDMSDDKPSSMRKKQDLQMATELFSIRGFQTGWLSEHGNGYAVSAELDGLDLWYWSTDFKKVQKAFSHACRRMFLRRFVPWLASARSHLCSIQTTYRTP